MVYVAIYNKKYFKFALGLTLCFLFRLIPFRPPNVEPILATQMPFSKYFGAYAGFLFAFFSIIIFDLTTRTLGIWTLFTASIYGLLGILAFYFFVKREPTRWNFVRFAILGTLFFDAATGLMIGPIFFEQTFFNALIGQIPFTLWHLLGNISFAFILSPAIYNLLIKNKMKPIPIISSFNPKII